MKIKHSHLAKAIEYFKEKSNMKAGCDPAFELIVRSEDIGKGVLCESISLTTRLMQDNSNRDLKTTTYFEYTIELFAENENRPPRMTIVETRELAEQPKPPTS